MEAFEEKYLNPHTDFGFKRLFGTEFNKDLLISFLNAVLKRDDEILDIRYLNSEQLGERIESRRAIFDVYCESRLGEKFIVEMQNVYQEFFKDRTVYYATFPIREQAKKGTWDFHLNAVYTLGLLNFVFDDDRDNPDYYHEVKLMDTDKKTVFYDKLTFIYLEIPKFRLEESQLHTMMEKWIYLLKNLSGLMSRPAALQERIFTRVFEQAEIAKFSSLELKQYEDSINAYRDILNALNTAKKESFEEGLAEGHEKGLAEGHEKGLAEGRQQEKTSIALSLKHSGVPTEVIIQATGLTEEEIQKL